MTLVFLAPNPPNRSGPTGARAYAHLVRELLRRGHRVQYIVCGPVAAGELSAASQFVEASSGAFSMRVVEPEIRHGWRRKARSAVWPNRPFEDCPVWEAVERTIEQEYDALHVEESAGWYGTWRPRALLSVQNIQAIDLAGQNLWRGLSPWKEAVQSGRQEKQVISAYRHVRCLTSTLAGVVRQINRNASTHVVPIALDLADYPMLPEPADMPTVGVIGSMFWRPSRDAAQRLIESIFPRLRRIVPDARLLIAGRAADRFLHRPAAMGDVEILSDVSDAENFFRRIHVLLYAPRHGSGLKVKVAEALAYGRGVVTTVDGTEGLNLIHGEHLLLGSTDAELASAAAEMLLDGGLRRRFAIAGREHIGDLLSPERTTSLMEQTYSSLCQS